MKKIKAFGIFSIFLISLSLSACASGSKSTSEETVVPKQEAIEVTETKTEETIPPIVICDHEESEPTSIKLLFAGDIMAHEENYWVDDFHKIWANVLDITEDADFAFANIESPLDSTKGTSTYPYFNMSKEYLEAAIDAGFNVFSLSNNHSSDQGLNGIRETQKTVKLEQENYGAKDRKLYFSGLKNSDGESFSYNIIEKENWKILFLPVTELLNLYNNKDYINYSKNTKEGRDSLINFCKKLREENPCDLFVLSFHTSEPEYVRSYSRTQSQFYQSLLEAGVDIVWANHAHIIKDRKIIFDTKNNSNKIIMYGNGNTISGQRRAPVLNQKHPNGERDNTGDGLLYQVVFTKENSDSKPVITYVKPYFITTYINTAKHFILRKLDGDFVNYLYNVPRKDWAEYISKRILINEEYTKDLVEWQ